MPTLEVKNAKYAEWLENANFDNCKLNRKEYGEFLASYITGEKDGFVLNLNGEWGTGKTEFLKRLYSHLLTKVHPTIYIDAWESDFSKDPLTVVSSELMTQLEKLNDNIGTESGQLKSFLGKALKGSLVGLGRFASAKLFNDGDYGADAVSAFFEEDSASFTEQLSEQYTQQIEAIKTIRDQLTQLAEVLENSYGANLPVVVLIDELDRCRPTYAIEMLEVIKHFFNTPKFVFVVATDTGQLSHSIKAVYGNNFNAEQYLKRFFDRKAALPLPDVKAYLSTFDIYSPSWVSLFPKIFGDISDLSTFFQIVIYAYDLKIRDVDQLVSKFNSILRLAHHEGERQNKQQVINLAALLISLVEFERNSTNYAVRGTSNFKDRNEYRDSIIENDLNFETFYTIAFDTVILEKSHNSEFYAEEYFPIHFRKMRENYYNDRKNHTSSMNIQNYAFQSRISNYSESNDKYWHWDDIKKAVELSGFLE